MIKWRALALVLAIAGCVSTSERRENVLALIDQAGWQRAVISAGAFDVLVGWRGGGNGILTVYVEGDGLAYVSPYRRSEDPTPTDPVALRLALADPNGRSVAYLARPCQYVMADHPRGCESGVWTLRRFAPDSIDSMDRAIDALKTRVGASQVVLIGYSGGGAVATLLAARRADVAGLVTVAATLDVGYWTSRDKLTPLAGSLDPASVADTVATIPQVHFSGGRDRTVGGDVTRSFLKRLPPKAPAVQIDIPDFTHTCCWSDQWSSLRRRPEMAAIAY